MATPATEDRTPDATDTGVPDHRRERRLLAVRRLGSVFHGGTVVVAAGLVAFALVLVYVLAYGADASASRFGWGFLSGTAWSLPTQTYGGWPPILGTLLTSGLAVLFAVPVALGVALFASEIAPPRWRWPLAYFVDLGAAIPSVVYGFWALEVLVPFLRSSVEPGLDRVFPSVGSGGTLLGQDLLAGSVILAIMILPTIAALSREALRAVPRSQREAALGLGATRWEATRLTVFGSAAPGIVSAIVLGLGRAVGETIAVALVIGGNYSPARSLLSSTVTIPSWLVGQFNESTGLERSALFELALILFVISLAINIGARLVLHRQGRYHGRGRHGPIRSRTGGPMTVTPPTSASPGTTAGGARAAPVRASRLRRRRAMQLGVASLALGAVLLAALPLASLIESAVVGGGSAVIQPSFYTAAPPAECGVNASSCPLGGIGPEIEGTLVLLGLAGAFGLPAGLLVGIYISEYGRRRFGTAVGVVVDTLLGIPSILIGVAVLTLFLGFDRYDAQSTLAGAAALGLLMIPIVAKATETALATVPLSVREGALALGFPRHRVTLRVVLGSCRSALVTGNLLAVMRAGGETAALVLTVGVSTFYLTGLHGPTPALAPFIYDALTVYSGSSNFTTDAWGAALVLLLIMGIVSLAARLALRPGAEGESG